ncbi:MAG: hypothetical protein F6K24_51465, partial [Okeania sp. SIO2D1]|nr:hypothetical protein [Okeania sp. SIO2D1]
RNFGTLKEVEELGRVGAIAWEENRKQDVQIITGRLELIQAQAEAESNLDLPLLEALGNAYQNVRTPGPAINVYEQILRQVRQQQDLTKEEEILNIIAEFQLAWFDYCQAAKTYQELLSLTSTQIGTAKQLFYLEKLVYIYEQDKLPKKAIIVKNLLAPFYCDLSELNYANLENVVNSPQLENLINYCGLENIDKLASLALSVADDYTATEQLELAKEHYQAAFQLSWLIQKFTTASDALQKLARLYQKYEQPEVALQIYEQLLILEQHALNQYNQMKAYDEMGELYLQLDNYQEALAVFIKGLNIAQSLSYQEAYFQKKITQVEQFLP